MPVESKLAISVMQAQTFSHAMKSLANPTPLQSLNVNTFALHDLRKIHIANVGLASPLFNIYLIYQQKDRHI